MRGWSWLREMTGMLQGLRQLQAAERWQLAGMMVALPLIHASLRMSGYMRTRQWLERWSHNASARTARASEIESARSIARLAAIAGRRGAVNATCLRQSLLVYWLLRRRGLAPQLKLGVHKRDGHVDAHAWVELEGRSLDAEPQHHHAFVSQADWPT